MMRKFSFKLALIATAALLTACGGGSESTNTVDTSLDNTQEVNDYYAANPDFFTFASMNELPTDLVWEDGMDEPDLGSPDAVKGGTFYESMEDFPPTLRFVGPDSNFSSRSWIAGYYRMSYAMLHPNTRNFIPGIAQSWAIDEDSSTVYIKINPEARWSDDVQIGRAHV